MKNIKKFNLFEKSDSITTKGNIPKEKTAELEEWIKKLQEEIKRLKKENKELKKESLNNNRYLKESIEEIRKNEYESLWSRFKSFLNHKDFDLYDGEKDIYDEFMSVVKNNELSTEEKGENIANYIEEHWGLYDGYWEVVDFINKLLFDEDDTFEGVAYRDTKNPYHKKESDPDKKEDFRTKIKSHIKSQGLKTKLVGDDLEILCKDERIGQVMFRDTFIGVREKGEKFVSKFKYTELGKIKSKISEIIKNCK